VRHGALSPCALVRASESSDQLPASLRCEVHLPPPHDHDNFERLCVDIGTRLEETKKGFERLPSARSAEDAL